METKRRRQDPALWRNTAAACAELDDIYVVALFVVALTVAVVLVVVAQTVACVVVGVIERSVGVVW